tara:strand:+ start:354 stop:488 length:135 start_codon:yes stop_codon:yes gene_type:complete
MFLGKNFYYIECKLKKNKKNLKLNEKYAPYITTALLQKMKSASL